VLRETRSSLQSEVEQLRRRLDDRESELQRTYREMNALTLTKDNEISSLRAELKMKTFEAHSLGATFEVSSLSLPPVHIPPSLRSGWVNSRPPLSSWRFCERRSRCIGGSLACLPSSGRGCL
jgi:hypothetical protein